MRKELTQEHGILDMHLTDASGVKLWLTKDHSVYAATAEDLVPKPPNVLSVSEEASLAEQVASIGKYTSKECPPKESNNIWFFRTQDSRQLLKSLSAAASRVHPVENYGKVWPNWYTMDFCVSVENNEYAYEDFHNRKTIDVFVVRKLFKMYYYMKGLHTDGANYDRNFARAHFTELLEEQD
jgi:hypothetical protein